MVHYDYTGEVTPTSRTYISSYGNTYFNPNAGNVGIGTDAPDAKLEVRDDNSTGIIVRSNATQATDTNKALRVRNNSDTNTFHVSHKGQGYFAGSVGIGTDNPNKQVHIEAAEPFLRLENTHAGSKRLDLRVEENDNHAYISAPQSGQNLNLYGKCIYYCN